MPPLASYCARQLRDVQDVGERLLARRPQHEADVRARRIRAACWIVSATGMWLRRRCSVCSSVSASTIGRDARIVAVPRAES